MRRFKNLPLKLLGIFLLFLAIVGAILPIMPHMPFLLGAAACFIKSSPKVYNWLIGNRFFGKHLRRYRNKEGVPAHIKVFSIIVTLLSFGFSAIWIVPSHMLWLKLLMIAAGLGSSLFILLQPTFKAE